MEKIFFKLVLIALFIAIDFCGYAQFRNIWKRKPHEVSFGIGTNTFLGELGGSNSIGSHSIKDMDFKATRFDFHGSYTYRFHERWACGASLSFGMISGNDAFTGNDARNARNLSFRSPLLELSPLIYFYPMVDDYSISRKIGQRGKAVVKPRLYLFTGVSGIWFNPRGKYTDGKWHSLQPLGTEGQGIISTRQKYSRIAVGIPCGIGADWPLTQEWLIGVNLQFTYTFTDYLDDVSTTYVDPNIFDNDIARYFSDPTKYSDKPFAGGGAGEQRGNSAAMDSYIFLSVKATYRFGQKYYRPKY